MPVLNTTSTADISFMLLIFFLVASSLDIDMGLARMLPPADKQEEQVETLVEKKQLLVVDILADNSIAVNGEATDMSGLRQQVADFISVKGAEHLISVNADASATYDTYFSVQNQLVSAYRDVRNNLSVKQYKRTYDKLTQ